MSSAANVICPQCGESTIPQRQSVWGDDFTSSIQLRCIFCNATWDKEVYEEETVTKKSSALASLLGVDESTMTSSEVLGRDLERKFCRDCAEYVAHPFLSRCAKHKKEVNPMDDCSEFIEKNFNSEKVDE